MPQLTETIKIVAGLGAVGLTGSTHLCDAVSMENYAHFTAIVQIGANAGASDITLCDMSAANSSAIGYIGFNYRQSSTGPDDALGNLTAATTDGISMSSADNCMTVIELDASELDDGKPWVAVNTADPSAATFASVTYLLSGARYKQNVPPTAIA